MENLELFPLKIYKFKVPEKLLKQIIELESNESYLKRSSEEGKNIHNYGSSTGDMYLYRKKEWKPTFKWISECLQSVKNDQKLICENLEVCLAWLNKSHYGEWHHPHTHPISLISGILYLKGDSGRTWFSLINHYHSDFWKIQAPDDRELIYRHEQKSGELLLFPSNLKHSVDLNMSAEERVTLSFNTLPTGKVGLEQELFCANITVN
jgi:uncharacterized protein (TIGR02466 family)